jgi:hypothetical protein
LKENYGTIQVQDYIDRWVPLHFEFIRDIRDIHPAIPRIPKEIGATLVHGSSDVTIPLAMSQEFVEMHPWAALHVVDDDHALMKSMPQIIEWIFADFQLAKL